MKIFAALFFAAVLPVAAQTPQVPHKIEFAGMTLHLHDDARREIQQDVDALTKSPKHFNIKVERARSYFPIIEKVFAEERLPDDFKYLALQESSLVPDAVSVSNAVGFWQFKDFTAIEMGLRVDQEVDERQNIVSSSRAAARYLIKNNTFFDNWVYALQAYQMGAGGVMRSVKDTQAGATKMTIDKHTYWYVKKYLAHKIAYEQALSGRAQTPLVLYENKNGKHLRQIATEVGVTEEDLLAYNKWTRSGSVPGDRTYVVAIPVIDPSVEKQVAVASSEVKPISKPAEYLKVPETKKKRINGVAAIEAQAGETISQLAARAGIELSKFLRWNDLEATTVVVPGEYYFLGKKRGRAEENFHKVSSGENLWMISQRYGVQLRKLKKFNRLGANAEVGAGQMLYLASTRPKEQALTTHAAVGVTETETFNWEVQPANAASSRKDSVSIPPVTIAPEPLVDEARQTVTQNDVVLDTEDSTEILQEPAKSETPIITPPADAPKTIAAPVVNTGEHTVQTKETLYSIAKMYNIGVMDLVKWNGLDLQQGIKVGQLLRTTGADQTPKEEPVVQASVKSSVHEVKPSDTLYSIARLYGVTIKDLMDWNGKKDFSLSVGEKLRIQR